MKSQDIAVLILVVSISLVVSYFAGTALFASDEDRSAEVVRVIEIDEEFPQPSENIFNEDAINLVETITIGDSESEKPFESE